MLPPLATAGSPLAATRAVWSARRLLHFRRGLPLAAAGGLMLFAAGLPELRLEPWGQSIALAAFACLVAAALFFGQRAERCRGMWAKPDGEPALSENAGLPPHVLRWVQLGAVTLVGAALAAALGAGITVNALLPWLIGYGMVHMACYCTALWAGLGLREQALAAVWFACGTLFWTVTRQGAAAILGGGCTLAGALLYARLRAAHEALAATDSASEGPR